MSITLVSTLIAILVGILTSIKILKEFFNPDFKNVQQNNIRGTNYYIDNKKYINNTINTKINYSANKYTSNEHDIIIWVTVSIVTLVTLSTFYAYI